jgi:hypothetical protein
MTDPDETTPAAGASGADRPEPSEPDAEAQEPEAASEPEPEAATEPEPEAATELAADIEESAADGAATDEVPVEEPELEPVPATAPSPAGRREAARPAPAVAAPIPERAIRVDDRISKIFVLVTVAAFVLVFVNALLFGVGGAFNPYSPPPAPTPSPSAVASPSASAPASSSASPSASTEPSPSTAPSPSASPTLSASPSPS